MLYILLTKYDFNVYSLMMTTCIRWKTLEELLYKGCLISKVSYWVVLLVVGGKKRLRMRSVVDTV